MLNARNLMLSCIFKRTRNIISSHKTVYQTNRQLYSKSVLGIEEFQNKRTEFAVLNPGFVEEFRSKIPDMGPDLYIKIHELMRVIYLSEAKDTNLIMKMAWRYYNWNYHFEENKNHNATQYNNFGSLIMKMFWHHNLVEEAIQAINFVPVQKMFHTPGCYQCLFDLMYSNNRYEEIVDIYEKIFVFQIQKRTWQLLMFPLAACFKLNTNKSCKKAITLLKEYRTYDLEPNAQHLSFIVMLFINMNKFEEAHKLLKGNPLLQTSIILQNLQIIVRSQLDDFTEVILLLQDTVYSDNPQYEKSAPLYAQETIDFISDCMEHAKVDDRNRLQSLLKMVADANMIQDTTIEDQLYEELKNIHIQKKVNVKKYV